VAPTQAQHSLDRGPAVGQLLGYHLYLLRSFDQQPGPQIRGEVGHLLVAGEPPPESGIDLAGPEGGAPPGPEARAKLVEALATAALCASGCRALSAER